MQTIILCGGLGTRLREETEYRPKPMVNIGSRPILWHIMMIYATHGHKDFILPLGYKGNHIREYFLNYKYINSDITVDLSSANNVAIHGDGDKVDWSVTMVDTGESTLKGGRIKLVEKYVKDDTFLLTYGDGVADIDIHRLVAFHKSHGRIATVTGVNIVSRYGELHVAGNQVTSFIEKPMVPGRSLISGGFFVFNRGIFDYLSLAEDSDLEYGALERVAQDGQLMVYPHDGFWYCMDTLRDVELLNTIWKQGNAAWKIW